jgi:hypothetical protein
MSFEARCPQCLFVTRQLGQPTPCLLHVSLAYPSDSADRVAEDAAAIVAESDSYDEPYEVGQLHLSVDRPGPFSLREYVRLQLLRSRVQANPSRLDQPQPVRGESQARSLSRR